jgi:hypothetical protein
MKPTELIFEDPVVTKDPIIPKPAPVNPPPIKERPTKP